jgi:hypothetical protein
MDGRPGFNNLPTTVALAIPMPRFADVGKLDDAWR